MQRDLQLFLERPEKCVYHRRAHHFYTQCVFNKHHTLGCPGPYDGPYVSRDPVGPLSKGAAEVELAVKLYSGSDLEILVSLGAAGGKNQVIW